MSSKILFNGSFRDSSEATIFCDNSSYLYGLGVFTTMLWDGSEIRDLDKHLARLGASVKSLFGSSEVFSKDEQLEENIKTLISLNSIKSQARVRITLTPAKGAVDSLVSVADYESGKSCVSLITSDYKVNPSDALSGHKSTSYANYLLALKQAKAKGGDEALLLNVANHVCEGSTSNVYFIKEGILHTPSLSTGCLPGIMRANLLESCLSLGIEVVEGEFKLEDFKRADSALISNSLKRLKRVNALDGVTFEQQQCELTEILLKNHGT